jgi:hypothetical protein
MFKKRLGLLSFVLVMLISLVSSMALVSAAGHDYYIPGAYASQDSTAFLDIMNPGDDAAEAVVDVYYEKNDSARFTVKMEGHSSRRVDLSQYVSEGAAFGAVVSSGNQLVVGSAQYDSTYSAGFGSLAALKPDFGWYFAEGYSSGLVKTYLYILNPGSRESDVTVTLYYDSGEKKTFRLHAPAERMLRIDLKEKTMPEKRFGMRVTGTSPVVVSAANYNKHFSAGTGGIGATSLGKTWYFASGYTSTDASEFLNVLNPSLGVAHLKVTLYYEDGSSRSFEETVPAGSKKLILLDNYAEELKWFSTVVESDVNIAAETTHYDDTYSAGHGGIGAVSASKEMQFSPGKASDKIRASLALFNPSAKEADISITFIYSDGSVKTLEEKVPSMMRRTVDLNRKSVPGKAFGLLLDSTEPVVATEFFYDEDHSAGYGYTGAPVLFEEAEEMDVDVPLTGAAVEETGGLDGRYTLVDEGSVPASKFSDDFNQGMADASKYTYDLNGSTVVAWRFSYDDESHASEALDAALKGSLFTLLESGPADIEGGDAYYFVSEKSEGLFWLNSQDLYVFVAEDRADASGLAEVFASGAPGDAGGDDGQGMSLSKILLILGGLIVLVIILKRLFRRSAEDEEAAWADTIPSAKPETRSQKEKKGAKKTRKNTEQAGRKKKDDGIEIVGKKEPAEKDDDTAKEDNKEKSEKEDDKQAKRHVKKRGRPAKKKKEEPAKKAGKEEKKEENEEKRDDDREEKKEGEQASGKQNISIKEIPSESLTAQDILDQLDEIPEYEDVFRHVNRDHEVIKPK